jgi:hypothetical protein
VSNVRCKEGMHCAQCARNENGRRSGMGGVEAEWQTAHCAKQQQDEVTRQHLAPEVIWHVAVITTHFTDIPHLTALDKGC